MTSGRMIGNKRARRRKYYNIRFKPFTVGVYFYTLTIDNKIVFKKNIKTIEPTVLYFSIHKNRLVTINDGFYLKTQLQI
jgi:hypothetical protein